MKKFIILSLAVTILCGFSKINTLDYISFTYTEKIIENKKRITVEGNVYFNFKDKLMVTYLRKPINSLVRVNSTGDMEVYDYEKNTLFIDKSGYTSNEQSYLWFFLTNNYSDMGLAKAGYSLKETKIEEGYLVHYWIPKVNNNIKHILLAFNDKKMPVYQEIITKSNETKGKIYFMNYTKLDNNIYMPTKIVDVFFKSKKDSSVSIKEYSNAKINKDVDLQYFKFKIPANAQIINK